MSGRSPVLLSDVKVGDVVAFYLDHWKTKSGQRKTAIGKVTAIHPDRGKTGQVAITRFVNGNRADCSIPPARIVGFHIAGMPF